MKRKFFLKTIFRGIGLTLLSGTSIYLANRYFIAKKAGVCINNDICGSCRIKKKCALKVKKKIKK